VSEEEEKQDAAEPEFTNRAERRAAKRRKGGASQPHQHDHGKGPTAGDTHGPAGARRNYGTRRTGG
jgi:hypothetical protein